MTIIDKKVLDRLQIKERCAICNNLTEPKHWHVIPFIKQPVCDVCYNN